MMGRGIIMNKPKGRQTRAGDLAFIRGESRFHWGLRDSSVQVPEKLNKVASLD